MPTNSVIRNQKGLSGDGLSLLHGATLGINNSESKGFQKHF